MDKNVNQYPIMKDLFLCTYSPEEDLFRIQYYNTARDEILNLTLPSPQDVRRWVAGFLADLPGGFENWGNNCRARKLGAGL